MESVRDCATVGNMQDRDLYARILGIEEPWVVEEVGLSLAEGEVVVRVRHSGRGLCCPECSVSYETRYDTRERRWRHLDTCQYRTILIAQVPRVRCKTHGTRQISVPWAESGSRFTALFEALVIDWLKEASIKSVARQMGLTWDQVSGIMERAVSRGLARREVELPTHIGVDETSFQKRHEYVTVVSRPDGAVVHVADGHGKAALDEFYGQFSTEELRSLEVVAMDMWNPYIQSTMENVPGASEKIAFDKFHVAKHLSDAVNKVRHEENRELTQRGDGRLKGSRYKWLMNPNNMDEEVWREFAALRESSLRTARAWAYKEAAMMLWDYQSVAWTRKVWQRWYRSAIRSRLKPMKKVARMVKSHLDGIVTAVVKRATNARAEGINSVIQGIKYRARGYRNRVRFRNAIYFHLGKLDLYPETLRA